MREPGFRFRRWPTGLAVGWRGALAIFLGVLAVSATAGTARDLSIALGVYAAAESIAALGAALGLASRPLLVLSIVDSAVAGYLLLLPTDSQTVLAYVAGAWAMASGILDLFALSDSDSAAVLGMPQAAAGAVALFAGVALAFHPQRDALELAAWFGAAWIARGVFLLAAGGGVGAHGSRPALGGRTP